MLGLTTPPLAPKVIHTLAKCQITSLSALQAMGPCKAFLLLKQTGLTITQSVLWQLIALCEQCTPEDLNEAERQKWLARLANMPPVALFPAQSEMEWYMQQALQQAQYAAENHEIPVGAVLVYQGEIIAKAYNRCIQDCDVSHHAEIQVLAKAGKKFNNYRLEHCDLYVSLEPCSMCASAIMQARIKRLIYAACEPKMGAAGSVLDLFAIKTLNHHTAVFGGVLAAEAKYLLQTFFQQQRKKNNPLTL